MIQRLLRTGFFVIVSFAMVGVGPFVFARDISESSMRPIKSRTSYQVRIRQGDTLWDIARKHGTSVQKLVRINGIRNPNALRVGMRLSIPGETMPQRVAVSRSRTGNAWVEEGSGDERSVSSEGILQPMLSRPMSNGVLTSGYGYRWGRIHRGVDWSCPMGTSVRAAAPGVVCFAGWRSGYGWLVEIDHGDFRTRYAHNSQLLVGQGQIVYSGDVISLAGSTGRTTGPHLHFELIIRGTHVNPLKYIE